MEAIITANKGELRIMGIIDYCTWDKVTIVNNLDSMWYRIISTDKPEISIVKYFLKPISDDDSIKSISDSNILPGDGLEKRKFKIRSKAIVIASNYTLRELGYDHIQRSDIIYITSEDLNIAYFSIKKNWSFSIKKNGNFSIKKKVNYSIEKIIDKSLIKFL